MRNALLLALVLATPALAGCMGGGAESAGPPDVTPPSGAPSALFQVASLTIRPANDPERLTIYEDDGAATIRYVIAQPATAGRETAFVTYVLNGRIIDVQQITLDPGTERAFERSVPDVRATPRIEAEVRAGSSMQRAEAQVLTWPRAGADTLTFGPLTIRADYGLLEQDGRVLVNLTIHHVGPAQTFDDLRVKMLCVTEQGTIAETRNVRIPPPTLGNMTGMDVSLEDCRSQRYGLEFKANGDEGVERFARFLL